MATNHIDGGVDVASAGTAIPLASTRITAPFVTIQAKIANVGVIFLGGSNVSSTSFGIQLASGDSYTFPPVADIALYDLREIFIDAANDGEGITVLYVER